VSVSRQTYRILQISASLTQNNKRTHLARTLNRSTQTSALKNSRARAMRQLKVLLFITEPLLLPNQVVESRAPCALPIAGVEDK